MQQIIVIGGGGYAANPRDIVLEEYVLKQTYAARPKVCYLPQAGGESREYIVRFYEAFIRLDAIPSWFSLFGRVPADWSARLLNQDVLFVGGGNTRSMLALWREWGVDTVLRQALEKGIVLAGISAGAICWFQQAITDSAGQLSVVGGLGFLEGSCCPHYDSEPEQQPVYRTMIAHGRALPGIALDDGVALHYVDGKLKQAVTARSEARGYYLTGINGLVSESALPVVPLV